ncbi:MAG: Gfo/Idh/MocA family oxidoreductase [Phycisphaerales bacterium]
MSTDANASPVRFVFVGAGGIAKTHANAAKGIEGVEIVGAADPSAEALTEFTSLTGAKGFSDTGAMLDAIASGELHADALFLCTPPAVRRDVIEPALSAGLSVLMEKPIARTAEEGRAIVDLADEHAQRAVGIGYCHRFTPAVLEMRSIVASGRIGRLTRFENVFAFHHPPMGERWFSDPAVSGGGSFIDTGCHSLDLFQFLVGVPKTVGAVTDHDWPGRGESSATVLVRAAEGEHAGVAGVILAGWLEPARFQVRLVGTGGMLFYDYEHPEDLVLTGPDGATETIRVETHEVRFARQLEAFAAAVRDGRSASESGLASAADGLAVARAVDMVGDVVRL